MGLKSINRLETISLFLCGLVFLLTYILRTEIFQLIASEKLFKIQSNIGHYLLIYAGLFLFLGLLSIHYQRKKTSIHQQLRIIFSDVWNHSLQYFRSIFHFKLSKTNWFWLIGFTLVGVILRIYYSDQPMRSDEGATYYYFVSGPLYRSFIYLEPNNHVLHTLLARISIGIFGNQAYFLRLPAILSGLICLPLIFSVSQKIIGEKSGFAAMALMAIYPVIILFDTQARGYSLVNLFTLSGVFIALLLIDGISKTKQFLLAVNTAFGLFVMPSFLFPAAGIFIFLGVSLCIQAKNCHYKVFRVIFPIIILAIIFTFILYTPVVLASGGIDKIIANETLLPLSWEAFFSSTPHHLLQTLIRNTQGVSILVLWVSVLILLIGIIWLLKEKKNKLLLLLLSMIVGSFCIYIAKRSIPFPRTWLFFLPMIFLLFDAGFSALTEKLSLLFRNILSWLVVGVFGFMALSHIPKNTLQKFNTFGTFENAEEAGIWISERLNSIEGMQFIYPARYTTLYYILQQNKFDEMHLLTNNNTPNYFILKKDRNEITDLTRLKVKKVFEFGDAIIFEKVIDTAISRPEDFKPL